MTLNLLGNFSEFVLVVWVYEGDSNKKKGERLYWGNKILGDRWRSDNLGRIERA